MRPVGVGIAVVAVVIAVAMVGVVFDTFFVAIPLVVALFGLLFLFGSILSVIEIGQRIHQLLRLTLMDISDGHDVSMLAPGTHWLRIESVVEPAEDPLDGVLLDSPVVARTVEGGVRERLIGIPWLSTRTRSFDETDWVPTTLDRSTADLTMEATGMQDDDAEIRVVGGDQTTLTVDDTIPRDTRTALAEFDIDVEADIFRGAIFEHYVQLTESTVTDGETAHLFGRFTIETDCNGTTLRPAGRFATQPLVTTAGWYAVRRRVVRRLGILLLLAPLSGVGGLLMLFLVVS